MSKISLDSKAKCVALVIDPPNHQRFDVETFDLLDLWLEHNAEHYAYILHDLDVIEKEDGEVVAKVPHIHVYAKLAVCQRLYTTLNKLAQALGFENNEPISIEKATDPDAVVQYLIHKNNPEKHQYDKGAIRTNLSEEELEEVLRAEVKDCSITFFVSVCVKAHNLVQVIEAVGLEKYARWRNVILDVWKDVHAGRRD